MDKFHTLFWCFYCWLWISKYQLGNGLPKVQSTLKVFCKNFCHSKIYWISCSKLSTAKWTIIKFPGYFCSIPNIRRFNKFVCLKHEIRCCVEKLQKALYLSYLSALTYLKLLLELLWHIRNYSEYGWNCTAQREGNLCSCDTAKIFCFFINFL